MTKSRINLYSASLLPPKQRLSFHHLTLIIAAFFTLGILVYGISWYQVDALEGEYKLAQSQQQSLDEQKVDLEAQLANRKPNPDLVAQVELTERRLALKKLLKQELSQRTTLISQGYSPMLTDLASVADASIWLSRIYVNEQHIEFEGFSQQPQNIPLWIAQLKNANSLKGFSFAAMTMNRGDDQPLAFKLTSQAVDLAKERAK